MMMKRLVMLTILAMISLTTQLQAQEINENIKLDNDVFTKKYPITVNGKDELKIYVKTMIKDGSLQLNIYNPAGELYDQMDLDASIGQNHLKSTIDSDIDNPDAGEWIVEVENKRGQGSLKIRVEQ